MDRFQMENIYKANGLNDFKLRNTTDILKCHGINIETIKGYSDLDDLNKKTYEKFIVKFFNCQGLDSRMELIPTGIYYVEDIECLAKDLEYPEYVVEVTRVIKSIDKNGLKNIIHSYTEDKYKNQEIIKRQCSNYLRSEYTHHGREEWLHVINGGEHWYQTFWIGGKI